MKIFSVFSITIILMACLFAGCGGDDDDDIVGPDGAGGVMGFGSMKPGDWAEHRTPEGYRDISKYLGEDTWQGRSCTLIEFESYHQGQLLVNQMWMDNTTGEIVLFLIKENEKVMYMDLSFPTDVPGESETWEQPTTQKIGSEKYTTPTGKTVEATIYQTQTSFGTSEDWVSSEVPFESVKLLTGGRLISSLYDYGTGATRNISKQEAENAEPFSFEIPDIPGGDTPVIPDPGVPDPGIPGGVGVVITVGAGPRPTISVSQPIQFFSISKGFMPVWCFESPDDPEDPAGRTFAGPFTYGILPNGAEEVIGPAPDLVAGQTYIVQVIAWKGIMPVMGNLMFTR